MKTPVLFVDGPAKGHVHYIEGPVYYHPDSSSIPLGAPHIYHIHRFNFLGKPMRLATTHLNAEEVLNQDLWDVMTSPEAKRVALERAPAT